MVTVIMPLMKLATMTGPINLPGRGKLHVLFGLIFITQYFTGVTTSVSLREGNRERPLSLSVSGSSYSSLAAVPTLSHHTLFYSSSSSSIPTTRHFLKKSRNVDLQLVSGYLFDFSPTGSGRNMSSSSSSGRSSSSGDRLVDPTMMIVMGPEKEVLTPVTVKLSMSKNRQHQKRQVLSGGGSGSENGTKGEGGNHVSNNSNNKKSHHRLVVDSESEKNENRTLQESNLFDEAASISLNNNRTRTRAKSASVTEASSMSMMRGGGDSGPMCRHKKYFPPDMFRLDTCAWCYKYMKNDTGRFGSPSKKLWLQPMLMLDPESQRKYVILGIKDGSSEMSFPANISDPDSPIWATFETEKAKKDWTGCCRAAEECCDRMVVSWKHSEFDVAVESQGKHVKLTGFVAGGQDKEHSARQRYLS